MHDNRSVKCPICKKTVEKGDPHWPFCSDRCRLLDLGNWASERYVISTPLRNPDDPLSEELEPGEDEQ